MSNRTIKSNPQPGSFSDDEPHQDDVQESDDFHKGVKVITSPNDMVDGLTITEWSHKWLTKLINTPAGNETGLNDPTGRVAERINDSDDKMYFITAQKSPGADRTFHVGSGQDVFMPIVFTADAEGEGIDPTIPSLKDQPLLEVQTVLAAAHFTNVSLSVDNKPITDLHELLSIFSAGDAQAGTAAIDAFSAMPGAHLDTVGLKGYFAVLDGLSEGSHKVSFDASGSTAFGPVAVHHTNTIFVD